MQALSHRFSISTLFIRFRLLATKGLNLQTYRFTVNFYYMLTLRQQAARFMYLQGSAKCLNKVAVSNSIHKSGEALVLFVDIIKATRPGHAEQHELCSVQAE